MTAGGNMIKKENVIAFHVLFLYVYRYFFSE